MAQPSRLITPQDERDRFGRREKNLPRLLGGRRGVCEPHAAKADVPSHPAVRLYWPASWARTCLMISSRTGGGNAPTTEYPLMKNVGVPLRSALFPNPMS